jgi:hypothetical protein
MIRILGASALAITAMTAAAQAAHFQHHVPSYGFRRVAQARHIPAYRHDAVAARTPWHDTFDRDFADRRQASEQDSPRGRYAHRRGAFQHAYASYEPETERGHGVSREPSERRYAFRQDSGERHASFDMPHLGARPGAWCGWYARSLVGTDPGPAYNLARNWANWGHAASPGPGVMVVWPHHVGMITGRSEDGQWIVKSGNDGGGMVRERPRSVAGAIAFRAS